MVAAASGDDSFQVRVKNAIKGSYKPCMRRSLQSVVLYEAERCLAPRFPSLRPFQKKIAALATATDLLKSLDCLNDFNRQEIMFRTNSSQEPLAPDLAFRRMKVITKEIGQSILPKAKELLKEDGNSEKSHDEFCDLLLQRMYEESTDNSKPRPFAWEFNHNNLFLVYRIYYRGVDVDPHIFPAKAPRAVMVPNKKPANMRKVSATDGAGVSNVASITADLSVDDRRAMLQEVKDHTLLLKEFEGIIPEEELATRKRALYAALPPVPPPAAVLGGGGGLQQQKKAKVAAASAKSAGVTQETAV